MTGTTPLLYVDLGSPYAYLAVERAPRVLGVEPRLAPILVGGIFALRGHGSWAHTPERTARIAEIDERAARHGLPPLIWPEGWPNNTLKAMRAATWAQRLAAGPHFLRGAFRAAFADGRDLSNLDVLVELAASVGLPARELPHAIEDPAVKAELKDATARAWDAGVVGVPCLEINGEVFYGDDQLERAARLLDGLCE
jgi:2-hydroxychromene-2-carboxylate isomerase